MAAINVEESNTMFSSLDGVLFNKDKTQLMAFPAGHPFKNYVIPSGVTSIGWGAFTGCSNLKSIDIPNSVTSIGYEAFEGCIGLTNVTIGGGVTSIENYAFQGCFALEHITSLNVTPPTAESYSFSGVYKNTCVLQVKDEAVEAYKQAFEWKDFLHIIGGAIETGIANTPDAVTHSGKTYTIQGTEASKGYKGIGIKNGKKVLF